MAFKNLIEKSQKERVKVLQKDPKPPPSFSRLSHLPYEIRCLILDYLNYKDISILRTAVPYQIEESYWCARMASTSSE